MRVPRELGDDRGCLDERWQRVLGLKGVNAAFRAEEELVPRFAPLDVVVVELTVRLVRVLVQAHRTGAENVLPGEEGGGLDERAADVKSFALCKL